MFQTDDDGRVGNVLMGYASLMVTTLYGHYCIILNTKYYVVSITSFRAVLEEWQLAKLRPIFRVILASD